MLLITSFSICIIHMFLYFFKDLANKIFTFPQQTNTAHVRVTTSRNDLKAVTVCFRYF